MFLSAQFSGGGAKLLFGKVAFGQNWGFQNWVVAIFLGAFGGGGDCYWMMLLDALEGCSKKPIKIVFLERLVARYKKTEKHPPKKAKKGNFLHPFLGGV